MAPFGTKKVHSKRERKKDERKFLWMKEKNDAKSQYANYVQFDKDLKKLVSKINVVWSKVFISKLISELYLGRASQGKAVKKLIYYSYNNFFLQCNYDEGDCCECNFVIICATIFLTQHLTE